MRLLRTFRPSRACDHWAMPMAGKSFQQCSEPGCTQASAFRTYSRPAWCDDHITDILRVGALEPLEDFTHPNAWRLTRCLTCGCEAHYRFEYTLQKNGTSEATCRACYWRQWARSLWTRRGTVDLAAAAKHAEEYGFEYLGALTDPSLDSEPHRVRCLHCGRISAERLSDVGWGCSCQTNARRSAQTTNISGPSRVDLFKDSGRVAVQWWDQDANAQDVWETVSVRAFREVAWRCPDCQGKFTSRVLDMADGPTCPQCAPQRQAQIQALHEQYKVTPIAAVPELLAAWADEDDPNTVMVVDGMQLRRFRCPVGHHPRLTPLAFLRSGCPSCRGLVTLREQLEAGRLAPEGHLLNPEIAAQWDFARNAPTKLATVSPGSGRAFWWREPSCGHEWQDSPSHREFGQRLRCPLCRTRLDSLAYHFPEMAAQWASTNPLSAWQVRPTSQTRFLPTWVCTVNPGHVWQATLASRSHGGGCPECRHGGKSTIERAHHAAAAQAFGDASSGKAIRHAVFKRRASWHPDITVVLPTGRGLVIEYDGAYWHADKSDLDTEKSLDLIAAGYLVVRLREHPLAPLPIDHAHYAEFVVYGTATEPASTVQRVKTWAEAVPHAMP